MGDLKNNLVESILKRKSSNGGFFESPEYSEIGPVATSWAILACIASGVEDNIIVNGREYLGSVQKGDGRVCVSDTQPAAFWPTSLAILAWQKADDFIEKQEKAIKFLLSVTGRHSLKKKVSRGGHDQSIPGWPWIGDTHSWVEPTALAILALKVSGHGESNRAAKGLEMLMDRQLSNGGWNYGNTNVFGKELLPMPDSTAIALCALFGSVPRSQVEKSISYLHKQINNVKAPFSLGWGILALSVWNEKPVSTDDRISQCLNLQKTYGEFRTSLLSLLLISYMGPRKHSGIFLNRV